MCNSDIKHTLDRKQAEDIFEEYSNKEKPFFLRFGQLINNSTKIGNNTFIGAGSMLIAPVIIGVGAKTGAGSVVTKDVDDFITVVGNPAKIMDNA